MTLPEAIGLVLKASSSCHGGEIFVTKMPAAKMLTLAEVIYYHYNDVNPKRTTEVDKVLGLLPGSRLQELDQLLPDMIRYLWAEFAERMHPGLFRTCCYPKFGYRHQNQHM